MIKKRKFKSMTLFFLLAILLIVTIGVTIAHYYEEVTFPNRFKSMTYDIQITQEFNNTWGSRKVYISNKDSSNTSVVLRINYDEIWSKQVDDSVVTLSNKINGTNVVNKNWTSTFTNNFVDGLDGWYYYKFILSPNNTIQILDSINLNTSLIENTPSYDDYLNYNYNLIVNYEAIEVNEEIISSEKKKNVVISENDISWS